MWNLVYFTKNDVNTFTQTYSREHIRGGKSFIISRIFFLIVFWKKNVSTLKINVFFFMKSCFQNTIFRRKKEKEVRTQIVSK